MEQGLVNWKSECNANTASDEEYMVVGEKGWEVTGGAIGSGDEEGD